MIEVIWLIKLILAHLVTDFVLQPVSWINDRKQKHFASPKLYLHGIVTAVFAWIMMGWHYWLIALIILLTHTLIDGWKSYRSDRSIYFILDQLLHFIVIFASWYCTFISWKMTVVSWELIAGDLNFWKHLTAFIFVTFPAGIIIGQVTKQWRDKVQSSDADNLANAGKWIGIAERVIVLILVILNQFSAIGLLLTAKGIIRFNEKDRQEVKTEYLVIGTLLSIGCAILTGVLVKQVH